MTYAVCRDCLDEFDGLDRCPSCGSVRLIRHAELRALTIAHIDCDAFYASVEKRDRPELREVPLIVGGGVRGVVSTACYLARRFGVRSATPMGQARRLCPQAVVIQPDMARYAEVSRQIRAMMLDLTPLVEPLSLDEAFLDLTGSERLHRRSAAGSMAALQARIEREVGVTASVGLADCKFLAKIASDLDKPRGYSVIGRGEAVRFLDPRPVSIIWGVGPKTTAQLIADGYRTVGDLRAEAPGRLAARYGETGARLADLSRAQDARPVRADRETKSISAETTFETDIADLDALSSALWRRAERVSARAKAQDLVGGVITLKLRTARFRLISRRKTLPEKTQLADAIYRAASEMLRREIDKGPFRLIGVGLSDLAAPPASGDSAAFLFPEENQAAERREKAERAMDAIRARFGEDAIGKGRGFNKKQ